MRTNTESEPGIGKDGLLFQGFVVGNGAGPYIVNKFLMSTLLCKAKRDRAQRK